MRNIFSFARIVSAFSIGVVSSGAASATDPSEVAVAAYRAMAEGGDFAQFAEPSISAEDRETLNQIAKDNGDQLKEFESTLKEVKAINVNFKDGMAIVELSFTMVNGLLGGEEFSDTAALPLTQIDGKWYVPSKEILGGNESSVEEFPAEEAQPLPDFTASFDKGVLTVNNLRYKFIKVEAGEFTMGIPEDELDSAFNITAEHKVTLTRDYYLGETQVTKALWEAVMGSHDSRFEGDKLPVMEVSWNDCQTFIERLNAATGQNFRLPTEAEWEFAARGGKKSKNYKYAGGNNLDEVAWYDGNSDYQPHEVATKKPNELGLYDMFGNVSEWCSDYALFDVLIVGDQVDPQGPAEGYARVSRGRTYGDTVDNFNWGQESGDPEDTFSPKGLRLCLS